MSVETPAIVLCAARRSSVAASESAAGLGVPAGGSRASAVAGDAEQPLLEAPGAGDAGLGPFEIALGRRVREHEPARGVGAVVADDLVRVDDVLLRLGHLLRAADLDRALVGGAHDIAAAPLVAGRALDLFRQQPGAVGRAVGLVADHALGEQAVERLVAAGHLHLAHGAGPEARIEQVQDRVLDAADILVDRHPVVVLLAIERRRLEMRRGETVEVPARIDEGVERVGLAPRRAAAFGTGDMLPGRVAVERIARPVELDILGQDDRQILLRHRHDAARLAMDGGDRAAPVTLARHQPVAQAVLRRALADAHLLEAGDDLGLGILDRQPVQEIGVDDHAVLDERPRRRR